MQNQQQGAHFRPHSLRDFRVLCLYYDSEFLYVTLTELKVYGQRLSDIKESDANRRM